MSKIIDKAVSLIAHFCPACKRSRSLTDQISLRAMGFAKQWTSAPVLPSVRPNVDTSRLKANPLRAYFEAKTDGPGLWKWTHYFDIYHRHLAKFIGRKVTVAEIGVYSGGSMPMWRHYFGENCQVHGIDIEPACEVYKNAYTTIHIGDQADREFWGRFRNLVPFLDVIIDDGGHDPEQQIVTLEEMLPHLTPGGVYICEDIHGSSNPFSEYVNALAHDLNKVAVAPSTTGLAYGASPFQAAIQSIHIYPFVVVIEKNDMPQHQFVAPKHGSDWQPFLDNVI